MFVISWPRYNRNDGNSDPKTSFLLYNCRRSSSKTQTHCWGGTRFRVSTTQLRNDEQKLGALFLNVVVVHQESFPLFGGCQITKREALVCQLNQHDPTDIDEATFFFFFSNQVVVRIKSTITRNTLGKWLCFCVCFFTAVSSWWWRYVSRRRHVAGFLVFQHSRRDTMTLPPPTSCLSGRASRDARGGDECQ